MAEIKGGEKLEMYLAGLAQRVKKAATVKVGFLQGATYPDGTPVAMVAAIQNYGAPKVGIPPRPFFSNMVKEKSGGWGDVLGSALTASNYDASDALKMMGDHISGDLRQSIIETSDPPLKPATVKRKGFDKPLVDTGHMLQSIDYEVS